MAGFEQHGNKAARLPKLKTEASEPDAADENGDGGAGKHEAAVDFHGTGETGRHSADGGGENHHGEDGPDAVTGQIGYDEGVGGKRETVIS